MELDQYKSAWQRQSADGPDGSTPVHGSHSVHFLRASAIHDLLHSDDLTRLIFDLLFALLAVGVSFRVMPPGPGRIVAWLLAAMLTVDAITGLALVTRRLPRSKAASMLDFIRNECRQADARLQFDKFSQWIVFALAAAALLAALFGPKPVEPRTNAFDALARAAGVTACLAVAWRRAKSGTRDVRSELERHLKDLQES